MSYYIDVKAPSLLSIEDLRAAIEPPVECTKDPEDGDDFDALTFWRPGLSTRGATVYAPENGTIGIGLNAFSTEEDANSAIRLAKEVARQSGGKLEGEDGREATVKTAEHVFGAEWRAERQSEASAVFLHVQENGGPIHMTGGYCDFSLARQDIDGLSDGLDTEESARELQDKVAHMQAELAKSDVFVPSIFQKDDIPGPNGRGAKAMVLPPDCSTLTMSADYAMLFKDLDQGADLWIPMDALLAYAKAQGWPFFLAAHSVIPPLGPANYLALRNHPQTEPMPASRKRKGFFSRLFGSGS